MMEAAPTSLSGHVRPSASSTDSGVSSEGGVAVGGQPAGGARGGSGGAGGLQVMLKDVAELVRMNLVSVPSGFTKLGHPILYFPDTGLFPEVSESDLHLLFKYYLSVVPRTEQQGFALIIDRRSQPWDVVRSVFQRVAMLFPARIREVYLLHHHRQSENKASATSQLVEEFLLDFDIFHMDEPAELLHYVDAKCLPEELGGTQASASDGDSVESWLALQEHVEGFSYSARRVARRLAHFVGVLNQEDAIGTAAGTLAGAGVESLKEAASRNRGNYRRLRKELEDLTDHGLLMLKSLQRPEANVMQRLAVQVLCKQLDQAWTYFSRSWKMQDHVYVQYLELNTFQARFRELANSFALHHERLEREVPSAAAAVAVGFGSAEEANAGLDKLDSIEEALAADVAKAADLEKMGEDLLGDHSFVSDCVQPKCSELKMMCAKSERALDEKRRLLHKFLELFDSLALLSKWCATATGHLERSEADSARLHPGGGGDDELDVFSQIRQLDYLLSKSRELKLRSRAEFEEDFDDLKEAMSPQALFAVDDGLDQLEAVTFRVMRRREELRAKAVRSEQKYNSLSSSGSPVDQGGGGSSGSNSGAGSNGGATVVADHASETAKIRRENILSELLDTEARYVSDLHEILVHYKDKLRASSSDALRRSADAIFGNMDDLHDFHAGCMYPELERCGANPSAVARTFIDNCAEMRTLYSNSCRNMHSARRAIEDLGGEQNPSSVLRRCQQEAGHQLPLSSYLLKPMQRLTKYQLMLKDLKDSSNVVCGKTDLEEALAELIDVIKVVNDSMVDVDVFVKGLPASLKQGLGALCCQDAFSVATTSLDGSGGSRSQPTQLFGRNKSQRRYIFLYDNHVVFCKQISGNGDAGSYQFKFALGTKNLGMSSVVKGEEKKIELWVHGRSEVYVLEAKSKKSKEDFATALRKVIIRQKEHRSSNAYAYHHRRAQQQQQQQQQLYYDTSSSTATSTDSKQHQRVRGSVSSRLSRSRSVENGRHNAKLRSRSLDCGGRGDGHGNGVLDDDRSSPEINVDDDEEEEDEGRARLSAINHRYIVLADYMALTSREIDLSEDELVDLVKVGCAGWWYVRLTSYPYLEGWAPSTYLEKVVEA